MKLYNKRSYEGNFTSGGQEHGRLFPGSFRMDRITLGPQDIGIMVKSVSIFESLDSAFLYGEVQIMDVENMIYRDRITGNESLKIKLSDSNFTTELDFKCYKIGDRERSNPQSQTYTIYFCARELFYSQWNKISKAYTNMKAEDIIVDAFNEVLPSENFTDKFYFGESFEEQNMVVPNWDLAKTVNFIAGRTISIDESLWSNTYKFWQTIDGIFNFFPLEGLLSNKRNVPYATLTYDPLRLKNNDVVEGDSSSGSRIFSMESVSINNTIDHLSNINKGMYANRASIIDITQREIVDVDYDYIEEFDSDGNQHLASSTTEGRPMSLISRSSSLEPMHTTPERSHWSPVVKSKALFTADVTGDSQGYLLKTFGKRQSKNTQLENFELVANLPGHLGLMCGMIVVVNIPVANNPLAQGSGSDLDHDLSGEYLVKEVIRTFTLDKMELQITLVKDNVGVVN